MIKRLRFLLACFAVIKDPRKTEEILQALEPLANPKSFQAAVTKIKSYPEGQKLLAEKPIIRTIELDQLEKYPSGSVGQLLLKHMKDNHLNPHIFDMELKNELDYLRASYRKQHDIWHVITGYGVSVEDELALQSFTFAQFNGPGSILILALGMLHFLFFRPAELPRLFKMIVDGWQFGTKSKPMLPVKWEEYFPISLAEARSRLGIVTS